MNFGSLFRRKKGPGSSGSPRPDPDVDPGPWKGSRFCRPGGLPDGDALVVGGDSAGGAAASSSSEYVAVGATSAAATAEAFDMPSAADMQPTPAGHGNDAESLRETCVVLDTNAAIVYGEHANRDGIGRIGIEFRTMLCDESIERVVTPTVLGEAKGLCRHGRISKYALNRIEALAIKEGRSLYRHAGGHAKSIEKMQMDVANDPRSETAARWLAAKRTAYRKAHKADYGRPADMDDDTRRICLGQLCRMAASDRMIMAEAVCVAGRRKKVVLLSTDTDMTLFEDALVTAAGGGASGRGGGANIRVAVIPSVPRGKRGR